MLNKGIFRNNAKRAILRVKFCPFFGIYKYEIFCFYNMFIFKHLQIK